MRERRGLCQFLPHLIRLPKYMIHFYLSDKSDQYERPGPASFYPPVICSLATPPLTRGGVILTLPDDGIDDDDADVDDEDMK